MPRNRESAGELHSQKTEFGPADILERTRTWAARECAGLEAVLELYAAEKNRNAKATA